MKTRILVFTALVAAVVSIMLMAYANAAWPSLGSGYAITTNYQGKNVPLGTVVTATAGTTDSIVKTVTFKWKYPNGTVASEVSNVPVWSNGSRYDGKLIYYAQSTYTADTNGDWGVQALFNDPIAIRAASFNVVGPQNVVPEIPIIGTAGAAIGMSLGLGFFLIKRNKINH